VLDKRGFSFDADRGKGKCKSNRRSPFDFDRRAISAQGRLSTRPGTPGLAQDDIRFLLLGMTRDLWLLRSAILL
jgi:hypothetical protein